MEIDKEIIFGQVVAKANNYLAVPSKNGEKRIIKNERIRRYEESFMQQCKVYRGRRIDIPFVLLIAVYYKNNKADLDNSLKTILDCLQQCEVITDDNLCFKIVAEKRIDKKQPRVEFAIKCIDNNNGFTIKN